MSMPMSEAAWNEMEEERTALPFGGYGNAMAQEAAWYHAQGLACPFDCAACDSGADYEADEQAWWDELAPVERIAFRMRAANRRFTERVVARNYTVRGANATDPRDDVEPPF